MSEEVGHIFAHVLSNLSWNRATLDDLIWKQFTGVSVKYYFPLNLSKRQCVMERIASSIKHMDPLGQKVTISQAQQARNPDVCQNRERISMFLRAALEVSG